MDETEKKKKKSKGKELKGERWKEEEKVERVNRKRTLSNKDGRKERENGADKEQEDRKKMRKARLRFGERERENECGDSEVSVQQRQMSG